MNWADWALMVSIATLGGIVILWTVGGYYHIRYYLLRRDEPEAWKYQPARFLRPGQQRKAMLLGTGNLVIAGVITGTLIYAIRQGFETPIYFNVDDFGWVYTIGSTILFFVLVDGLAYYVHRALHQRTLFKYVHCHHHRFLAPTPFVVTAMHPLEFILLQAATFIPLFILPLHFVGVIAVFVYVFVFNIVDHSGVNLVSRIPWQGPSAFHDDHHIYFHCNFGQHLTMWDRMHGTLRRVDRRYGKDVFGGKGARIEGAADTGDVVRY